VHFDAAESRGDGRLQCRGVEPTSGGDATIDEHPSDVQVDHGAGCCARLRALHA
jgi:hypothetical protein